MPKNKHAHMSGGGGSSPKTTRLSTKAIKSAGLRTIVRTGRTASTPKGSGFGSVVKGALKGVMGASPVGGVTSKALARAVAKTATNRRKKQEASTTKAIPPRRKKK